MNLNSILSSLGRNTCSGIVPKSWKIGMVISILKPGEPKSAINSHRLNTLLSCIGKTLERIIHNRLQYVVDKQNLLDKSQFGFCKGDGAIEIHIRMEHLI